MKKHKHTAPPPRKFTGVAHPGFNEEQGADPAMEPPHRHLARGALAKAAQQYREGEIEPAEFHKHIAKAHSRLQEPMGAAIPQAAVLVKPTSKVTRSSRGREKHHKPKKDY